MDEVEIQKHMHEPQQILWFDTVEIFIIVAFYLMAILFEGIAYLFFVIGPYWLISEKRDSERGYVSHLCHDLGLRPIKGYPDPSSKIFHE